MATANTNYCGNPTPTGSAGSLPTGWTTSGTMNGSKTHSYPIAPTASKGSYRYQYSWTTGDSSAPSVLSGLSSNSFTSGEVVSVSGFLKGTLSAGVTANLAVYFYNSSGTYVNRFYSAITLTGSFQRFVLSDRTVPATAVAARVGIYFTGLSSGATLDVYFSSLQLEVSTGIANFVTPWKLYASDYTAPVRYAVRAPNPLDIPYAPTNNGMVHPSVVYSSAGWNGYKYWMAVTPFGGTNQYEQPHILCSNDSSTWIEPSGISNPIVNEYDGTNYDDDPCLFFNGSTLCCTWGYNDKELRMKTSTDGVTWSSTQTLFSTTNSMYSASVVHDGTWWHAYYVSAKSTASNFKWNFAHRMCETLTGTWGPEVVTDLLCPKWAAYPSAGYCWWHPGVRYTGGKFVAAATALYFDGTSNQVEQSEVYYAESVDGQKWGVTASPVIESTTDLWDSGIYQAGVVDEGGTLSMVYSGVHNGNFRTGFAVGFGVDPVVLMPNATATGKSLAVASINRTKQLSACAVGAGSARARAWVAHSPASSTWQVQEPPTTQWFRG